MRKPWLIATFYEFAPWTEAQALAACETLRSSARRLDLVGLCIVAPEGLNGTCSGRAEAVRAFVSDVRSELGLRLSNVQESRSARAPFDSFRASLRPEIVTLGDPALTPLASASPSRRALSPEEFHAVFSSGDPDVTVLDTRNWYETQLGRFTGAVLPTTGEFQEFPAWLRASGLAKDKPVLLYCTGGIRCEKAILEMDRQGFQDVRQLDGGILHYLEHYPEGAFEGECFVFDRRVAVDQFLAPSVRFRPCVHCGQPSEGRVTCPRCGENGHVCASCAASSLEGRHTCSKNCAHHWRLTPGKPGRARTIGSPPVVEISCIEG